jgi:DNA-binding NtrC family response regulator
MSRGAELERAKGTVLIVEDETHLRRGLADLLENRGFATYTAENGDRALSLLDESTVDVIITDMKMKGTAELPLIDALMRKAPFAQIIVMTAYGSVEQAVQAMKRGVHDYLTKPLNVDELLVCLDKALEKKRLTQEVSSLREALEKRYSFGNIIGKSPVMRRVYREIEKVARSDATVLILGESGTGKELVATAIHFNSPRKNGPFVTLNPSLVPESLLASELFGHERGAFTGAYRRQLGKCEAADKGTLFIDDVGDLSDGIQVSLLRFLQDREFQRVGGTRTLKADVRILAATNRDLYAQVKQGKFREDLFYRLNVVPIYLPPLRERKEDIPLLAEHFLRKYSREVGKEIEGLTTEAVLLLMSYDWPGNVRELEHLIERSVIMAEGRWIDAPQLLPQLSEANGLVARRAFGSNLNLAENWRHIEKYLIERALEKTGGNRTAAAKLLGITYRALRYKMKRHGYE